MRLKFLALITLFFLGCSDENDSSSDKKSDDTNSFARMSIVTHDNGSIDTLFYTYNLQKKIESVRRSHSGTRKAFDLHNLTSYLYDDDKITSIIQKQIEPFYEAVSLNLDIEFSYTDGLLSTIRHEIYSPKESLQSSTLFYELGYNHKNMPDSVHLLRVPEVANSEEITYITNYSDDRVVEVNAWRDGQLVEHNMYYYGEPLSAKTIFTGQNFAALSGHKVIRWVATSYGRPTKSDSTVLEWKITNEERDDNNRIVNRSTATKRSNYYNSTNQFYESTTTQSQKFVY